ncbi:MAG: metallophosphoesterase [Eubacteriaceae bacterium]|nr:metallophosphoesterase [Eubacteriaceae bacterium]
MIYVISDIHGYPFDKFLSLLNKANFNDEDYLFILGDVIDRGPDGAKYLKWLLSTPNAQLILGNHEEMMLVCEFVFAEVTEENISSLNTENLTIFANWQINGADPTLEGIRELMKNDREIINDILDYLHDCELWELVSVGEKDFLLTHSGLGNFRKDKKLSEYSSYDLLWNRPDISDRYFDDIITIFGHTPTEYFGEEYKGKIFITDTWIDIDTGAAMGNCPTLLRLDDMKTFTLTDQDGNS